MIEQDPLRFLFSFYIIMYYVLPPVSSTPHEFEPPVPYTLSLCMSVHIRVFYLAFLRFCTFISARLFLFSLFFPVFVSSRVPYPFLLFFSLLLLFLVRNNPPFVLMFVLCFFLFFFSCLSSIFGSHRQQHHRRRSALPPVVC